MKQITEESLKKAGFVLVEQAETTVGMRKKFLKKYELRTKWQVLAIYHYNMLGANNWRLGGIRCKDDRANAYSCWQLVEIAKAFGADLDMQDRLAILLED